MGFSDFPHHGDVVGFSNWKLSDLTSDFIPEILSEGISIGLVIFKIDQALANFGIDKGKLIRRKITNEIRSRFRVKPDFSHTVVVNDRRLEIVNNWCILLLEGNCTELTILTLHVILS